MIMHIYIYITYLQIIEFHLHNYMFVVSCYAHGFETQLVLAKGVSLNTPTATRPMARRQKSSEHSLVMVMANHKLWAMANPQR